jgi:hypothetical protein
VAGFGSPDPSASDGILPALRNAAIAVIEPDKFTRYCLDMGSEDRRHKARVFRSALGFEKADALEFILAIRQGIMLHEAVFQGETPHGFRWRVDLPVQGPNGRVATVRTA